MFDANLAYRARVQPRALAILSPRRRVTYAEFDADVNRYAAGLRELGIAPERGVVAVGGMVPYRRLVVLLALARLGVASSAFADRRADLRLTDRAGAEDAGALCLAADWIARVEAAAPVPVLSAPRDPDGLARVLLLSGVTGAARRVPLSWRRMEAGGMTALTAYAAGKLGAWAIRTGVDSSLGFGLSTLAWSLGAAVAVDYGDADLPHLMERQAEGLIGLTPLSLRNTLRRLPAGFEPRPAWRIVVTGGLLPPVLARAARQRLTPDIHIVYGATESGCSMAGPARLVEDHPGAVGYVVPGVTVELVDAQDAAMPDGEVGVVRIRSGREADRYLDDNEASARAFRDGWFYPGDLGRRLPGGLFVIEGRVDERMAIGNVKLSPNALENALLEHPQVRDAAAFAIPGPEGLDQCWVAVVVEGEVTREALLSRLREGGAPPVPVRFAWAEEIPRNEAGKIDRKALRAQTQAALEKNAI